MMYLNEFLRGVLAAYACGASGRCPGAGRLV
jgi:hypothetical protein